MPTDMLTPKVAPLLRPRAAAYACTALMLAGCDAILGLGDAPTEAAGQGGAGSTSTSTSTASNAGGGSTSTSTAQGTTSTAGVVTANTGVGGGGGSGGGGGGGTTTGQGTCGLTDDGCEEPSGTRCLRRRLELDDTVSPGSTPNAILGRFSRGLVVTTDSIAFGRFRENDVADPESYVTLLDRAAWGMLDLSLTGAVPGLAGGVTLAASPTGQVLVAPVDQTPNVILEVDFDAVGGPQLVAVTATPAQDVNYGALAWAVGSSFVGADRNAGVLQLFNPDSEATCALGSITSVDAGLAIARGELDGSDVFAVAHYGSMNNVDVVPVPTTGSPGGCPESLTPPDHYTVEATVLLGVAIASDQVYAQGVSSDGQSGIASTLNRSTNVPTYPSQAIAAREGYVYLPALNGGIKRCNAQLGECTTLVAADVAGKVSLLTFAEGALYSVGFDLAEPTIGKAYVTCTVDDDP